MSQLFAVDGRVDVRRMAHTLLGVARQRDGAMCQLVVVVLRSRNPRLADIAVGAAVKWSCQVNGVIFVFRHNFVICESIIFSVKILVTCPARQL
jgi:hypothetical protein